MLDKLEDIIEDVYSNRVVKLVHKYQKKYGFDMENNSTHNNEADAFKHAFMQAELALNGTQELARYLGNKHEEKGNLRNSQPKGEELMDNIITSKEGKLHRKLLIIMVML